MKIAVCFSGQIRTGVESSENIKNYLGDLYPYCDFFIHTWNKNGQKNYCATNIVPNEEYVSEETINKIKEIYKPKKMIVEDHDIVCHEIEFIGRSLLKNLVPSHWYSFNRCVQLKKEYENENGFIYDIVLKLRFDIIFQPERRLLYNYFSIKDRIDKLIYVESPPPDYELNESLIFINDVFYMGSSKNIDIFSDYYHFLSTNEHDPKNHGYFLYKHLNDHDIKIFNDPIAGGMVYAIYRPECLKYSPITDFQTCLECDAYYYYDIDKNYEYSGKYYLELLKKYEVNDLYDFNNMVYVKNLKIKDGYEDSSLY